MLHVGEHLVQMCGISEGCNVSDATQYKNTNTGIWNQLECSEQIKVAGVNKGHANNLSSFRSFTFVVTRANFSSDLLHITCGAPQGSILSSAYKEKRWNSCYLLGPLLTYKPSCCDLPCKAQTIK